MGNPARRSSPAWLAIPFCALVFLAWAGVVRLRHVEYVSAIGESAGTAVGAGWQPRLIVPDHNNPSYEWLDQTRQMFAQREWRVRHIDYENAPFGRDVYAASPYRWWLGVLAWIDHEVSGRPLGSSLERAALIADPLLHFLLLVGAGLFVAWQFGAFPAAVVVAAIAGLFPFSAEFLPGMPDDRGLALACAIGSVLLLLAGAGAAYSPATDADTRARRWFLFSGVVGGLGLWISVSSEVPILVGVAIGGLVAAWIARGGARAALPWRTWAFTGAATTFGACLVEYFPSHFGAWQLRAVHPLYGLAWVGGGELLARVAGWIQGDKLGRGLRDIIIWLLALATIAAVPVAMRLTHNSGFLEADLSALRLARLPDGPAAASFAKWIFRDGTPAIVWATILPLALVGPALWLLARRATGPGARIAIALALGPVLIAVGFAGKYLSWWSGLDGALLALLAATTMALQGTSQPGFTRWAWSGLVALVLLPGAIQFFPRTNAEAGNSLNESEVYGLIERDLARWLSVRAGAGGTVILAPHNQTFTLYYYGGLRGLATLSWENLDGLEAAMRMVSASTPEEARELFERRGVSYLVIPSWDSYLDVYAKMGMGKLEDTFLSRLHYWKLPPWLRPVAYQIPTIAGFEGQAVTILQVVEDQDDAAALSRVAEYFVDMGQLDQAANVGQSLRRFPADLGALVARAQVEIARDDTAAFARTVEQVRARLTGGADRAMPWDRRVSLAVVLARGKHVDQAREQVQRCLADVDEANLRALPTGSLYRLQVLAKAFGLEIADQRLRQLALDLLPEDLRGRLKS
jgi:hypothetical protein